MPFSFSFARPRIDALSAFHPTFRVGYHPTSMFRNCIQRVYFKSARGCALRRSFFSFMWQCTPNLLRDGNVTRAARALSSDLHRALEMGNAYNNRFVNVCRARYRENFKNRASQLRGSFCSIEFRPMHHPYTHTSIAYRILATKYQFPFSFFSSA